MLILQTDASFIDTDSVIRSAGVHQGAGIIGGFAYSHRVGSAGYLRWSLAAHISQGYIWFDTGYPVSFKNYIYPLAVQAALHYRWQKTLAREVENEMALRPNRLAPLAGVAIDRYIPFYETPQPAQRILYPSAEAGLGINTRFQKMKMHVDVVYSMGLTSVFMEGDTRFSHALERLRKNELSLRFYFQ